MAAHEQLDIASNRNALKYTQGELLKRVLWGFVQPLFRYSPRICFRWRSFLLRLFGAKVGRNVHIYDSAVIYMPWNLEIGDWSSIGEYALIYNLGKVTIGKYSTVSHKAHICAGTHDYADPAMPLLKPPITVGDQVWVCADAYIGPGVCIGEGSVVGARAVVTQDVAPWTVVAGNPARFIKKRIISHAQKT